MTPKKTIIVIYSRTFRRWPLLRLVKVPDLTYKTLLKPLIELHEEVETRIRSTNSISRIF